MASADSHFVPLYSWWSPSRGDNFATTNPDWFGGPAPTAQGYGLSHIEGCLIPPAEAQPPDLPSAFGYGTMTARSADDRANAASARGRRPLLVILVEYSDVRLRHTRDHYERLFFGPAHPNSASYFAENSYGKFTWGNTGVVGPVRYPSTRDEAAAAGTPPGTTSWSSTTTPAARR